MPRVGVHGGDHPIGGDSAGDAEHPITGILVEVLADHRGHQYLIDIAPSFPTKEVRKKPGTVHHLRIGVTAVACWSRVEFAPPRLPVGSDPTVYRIVCAAG